MGKKRSSGSHKRQSNRHGERRTENERNEGAATLKDLLSEEMIGKLKGQQKELQSQAVKQQEERKKQQLEKKKEEQRQKEQDFSYLLNNSSQNWRDYK